MSIVSRLRAMFGQQQRQPQEDSHGQPQDGPQRESASLLNSTLAASGLEAGLVQLCDEFELIAQCEHGDEQSRALVESICARFGEPVAIFGEGPIVRWHVGQWCLEVAAAEHPALMIRPWLGAMHDEQVDFEDQAEVLFPWNWAIDVSGAGIEVAPEQVVEGQGYHLCERMANAIMAAPDDLARLPERMRPQNFGVRCGGPDDLALVVTGGELRVRGCDALGVVDDVVVDERLLATGWRGVISWLLTTCAVDPEGVPVELLVPPTKAEPVPGEDDEDDEVFDDDGLDEDDEEDGDDEDEQDLPEVRQRFVRFEGVTHAVCGHFDSYGEWVRPFTFAELRQSIAEAPVPRPWEKRSRETTWGDLAVAMTPEQVAELVTELLDGDIAEVLARRAAGDPVDPPWRHAVALGPNGWPIAAAWTSSTEIDLLPRPANGIHVPVDQLRAEAVRIASCLTARRPLAFRCVTIGPKSTLKMAFDDGERRCVLISDGFDQVWGIREKLTLRIEPRSWGLGSAAWL